jgi:hypothetical protein
MALASLVDFPAYYCPEGPERLQEFSKKRPLFQESIKSM